VPIVLAHYRSLLLCLLQRRPPRDGQQRHYVFGLSVRVRAYVCSCLGSNSITSICCGFVVRLVVQQVRNNRATNRTDGASATEACRRNIEFLFSFFLANGATPRPCWSVAPRFDRSSLNEANNPVAKTWRSHHAARYWVWVRSKRPRSKTAPTVVR